MNTKERFAEFSADFIGMLIAHALFWGVCILVSWFPLWAGWNWGMSVVFEMNTLSILQALACATFLNTFVWILVAGGKMAFR